MREIYGFFIKRNKAELISSEITYIVYLCGENEEICLVDGDAFTNEPLKGKS